MMVLEDGYEPFLVNDNTIPEIDVHFIRQKPIFNEAHFKLVFEAQNETQRFYSIYKNADGLCFIIYNQQTIDEVQQIAYLNNDFDSWEIHSTDSVALKYPMGPILMHYLTLKTDAVLMHASCAYDGKKGRMFSGFSGAGKSTMSKIWADAGSVIINDDRLIIRKLEKEFFVYNTPMYYVDQSKKAPLDAIYLIRHASRNSIQKLQGAYAVSRIMAFCIQNNFDSSFISKRINLFTEICSQASIFDLGVVPTPEIIDFIKANE